MIDFGGINVALGVNSHGVGPVELPGIAAAPPEWPDHGTVVALQHPDFVVLAIAGRYAGARKSSSRFVLYS